MSSWTPPTADELDRLAVFAVRPENRAYFFDRLENPAWLKPLAERAFFNSPPAPEAAGEGYVRFPAWPEGRYLARVGGQIPRVTADVLLLVPPSENPRVVAALLDAVADLPREQLEAVSGRVPDWLETAYPEYFVDEAAQVIKALVESGLVGRGLQGLETLLRVQPDPRQAEKTAPDSPLHLPAEPIGRLSEYDYERLLDQALEPIVESAGIIAVRILCDLLERAVQLSGRPDVDSSHIWRPAIEPHDQNSDTGIRQVLVNAARDAALHHAGHGRPDAMEELVGLLQDGSAVQRRILLHVVSKGFGDHHLVSKLVAGGRLFDDHRLRHEYAAVLRRRFSDADAEAQQALLRRIGEGPDLDALAEGSRVHRGVEPDEQELESYSRRWRRDWFSFVQDYLTGDVAARYQELVDAEGESEHPDFLSWSSSGWVGPESPMTDEQLRSMPAQEVLEAVGAWRPQQEQGLWGPSTEGLGRALSTAVKERPDEFARHARQARGLDPTYVRSLLSGLEEALRGGSSFEWSGVLELAEFAAQQPFEPDRVEPDRDRDPGWRWCRRAIASLLRAGFTDSDGQVPYEHRRLAWSSLERLTRDPNPSPEHEQQFGGENMDPLTLSINTNRGTAMHAVIEYALWTRRLLDLHGGDVPEGFDAMPEVRTVLEAHLDTEAEPALAVRAVYGRWLPWLLLLDETWTLQHLAMILPEDPSLARYRDTAWATYVAWCPAYDSPFRALRDEYLRAARSVPSDLPAGTLSRETADEKLGEHLVTFHWRGLDTEGLTQEFFDRASDELAARVMEFVGRALRNSSGEVPPQIRSRIQELWDWRMERALEDPEGHREELRAFGVTFSSGQLDEGWSLRTLDRAIDFGGPPRIGVMVAKRLATIAETNPARTATLLAKMLVTSDEAWSHISWRDEARAIVAAAFESGDPIAKEAAEQIVDSYVRRGELDFRSLVAS